MSIYNVYKQEDESGYRIIDPHGPYQYCNNQIKTTSFTLLNIIPKTLLIEFQNIPYFWFLLIIVIEFSSYNKVQSLK